MAKKTSVRLMVPFSMHCTSCSHFIYKSTKFNARKSSTGEQYLGIAIVQFSIRCPSCGGEIVFRTDPKTSGYIVLSGADRNLEPWHDRAAEAESVEARLTRLAKQASGAAHDDEASDDGSSVDADAGGQSPNAGPDAVPRARALEPVATRATAATADTPQSSSPPASRVSKLPMPKRRKHLAKP